MLASRVISLVSMSTQKLSRVDQRPEDVFEAFENADVLGAVRLCAIEIGHAEGSCRRTRPSAEKLLDRGKIGRTVNGGEVGPELTKSRW